MCSSSDCLFQLVGGDKPYLMPDMLKEEEQRIHENTMHIFHTTRKMGGSEFSEKYANKLEEELTEQYENYIKHNESKNIFAAVRTPAVLFSFMVVCYVLSGLLGVLGLEGFANLVNLLMMFGLVLFVLWAYIRYSGEYRDVGSNIDKFADIIWENVSVEFCVLLFM
jgi:atlastin